jgi:hypothetical protein
MQMRLSTLCTEQPARVCGKWDPSLLLLRSFRTDLEIWVKYLRSPIMESRVDSNLSIYTYKRELQTEGIIAL